MELTTSYKLKTLIALVLTFLLSCKREQQKQNTITESQSDTLSTSIEGNHTAYKFGEMPFILPNNWVYIERPEPNLPTLTAQATNPSKPFVSASVWDYPTKSIEELLIQLEEDLFERGQKISYEIIDNQSVNGTTRINEIVFKWKARYFNNNDKLRLITVGAFQEKYDSNSTLIEEIIESIVME